MKFQSKADLLEAVEREHAIFVELVESLPPRSYAEAGVWGDGWTIKDLCAHLTEWEQMFLRWYRVGREGREPAVPAAGYKWNDTPRLNKAIWRKNRNKSWRKVREEFDFVVRGDPESGPATGRERASDARILPVDEEGPLDDVRGCEHEQPLPDGYEVPQTLAPREEPIVERDA